MNKKIVSYILFIALAFTLGSCKKKYFYDGINTDPNAITEPVPSLLLPAGQVAVAYCQGGDLSRYTGVLTQQYTGAARQFQSYNNYIFTDEDFNNVWNSLYANAMINFKHIMEVSDEKGYNYYGGVSRVMMAYTTLMCTDLWGNMPMSQAFQGAANLQPAYDSQEALYGQVEAWCDTAISQFALPSSQGGAFKPGGDDLMYGGDVSLWTKFAYAIKARKAIHLTKKGDVAAANAALAALANSFSSNDDDAQLVFGADETNASPWYQYSTQRGDISMAGTLQTLMTAKNDTNRLNTIMDVANDVIGAPFGNPDAAVTFITYSELKFIEAEANLILGNDSTAQANYTDGIQANFDKLGVADPDYLTVSGVFQGTTKDEKIGEVIYEKYVSLFTNPEAFADWRRTGQPILTPNSGSQIPRRFLYPSSENQYNGDNVPSGITLYSKLWWDN